jgi:hypothetical protein
MSFKLKNVNIVPLRVFAFWNFDMNKDGILAENHVFPQKCLERIEFVTGRRKYLTYPQGAKKHKQAACPKNLNGIGRPVTTSQRVAQNFQQG